MVCSIIPAASNCSIMPSSTISSTSGSWSSVMHARPLQSEPRSRPTLLLWNCPYTKTQGPNRCWLVIVDQAMPRVWSYFTRTKTDLSDVVVQHLVRYSDIRACQGMGSSSEFCLANRIKVDYMAPHTPMWKVPSSVRTRTSEIAPMLACWRVNSARTHHETSPSPRRTLS